MKRVIVINITIILLILLCGCSVDSISSENVVSTTDSGVSASLPSKERSTAIITDTGNIKSDNIDASKDPSQSIVEYPDIKLIGTGHVDTVEFGIDSRVSEILKTWGEPNSKDYFMGGAYISYNKVTFFIDEAVIDLEKGKVVKLGFSSGFQLFGVNVGMKFQDIKNQLGAPTFEGVIGDDVNDELFGKSNAIIYESGNYELLFIGELGSQFTYQALLVSAESVDNESAISQNNSKETFPVIQGNPKESDKQVEVYNKKIEPINDDDLQISEYKLEMTLEDFEKGMPNDLKEKISSYEDALEMQQVIYLFKDGTEFVFTDNTLYSIATMNSEYQTPRGLKVGDSIAKLIELYGNPQHIYNECWGYNYEGDEDYTTFSVIVVNKKVCKIEMALVM